MVSVKELLSVFGSEIVGKLMDLYESEELLSYFDLNEMKFTLKLSTFNEITGGLKEEHFTDVTEAELVETYGLMEVHDAINKFTELKKWNGDVSSPNYNKLAYLMAVESHATTFTFLIGELNNELTIQRLYTQFNKDSLKDYVQLLADIRIALKGMVKHV